MDIGVYSDAGHFVLMEDDRPLSCSCHNDILQITGCIVDRACRVSEVMLTNDYGASGDAGTLRNPLQSFISMVREAISDLMPDVVQDLGQDEQFRRPLALDLDPRNSDAFWRTLVGNVTCSDRNSMPAPAGFAEMFEILMYGPDSGPRHRLTEIPPLIQLDLPHFEMPNQSQIP